MEAPVRILVVDDNPDLRLGTARLLERAGYGITTASTGTEALDRVQQGRPDMVLLDRDLPGPDGLEVCRRIKRDPGLRDLFVILISGTHIEPEQQVDGLESGADGYLLRPIANRDLLARVRSFVRILGLNQSLREHSEALARNNESLRQAQATAQRLLAEATHARRQTEETLRALQESEARFALAFRTAPHVMAITHADDGRFVEVNEAFTRATGFTPGDVVGRSSVELGLWVRDDDRRRLLGRLETGEACPVEEVLIRRKDGRHFTGQFYAQRLQLNGTACLLSSVTDITARKQAESTLTFLANVGGDPAGEPFFHALARYLATSLQMEFVCIDRLEGDLRTAHTVAVWCDGAFRDNLTYTLHDTPCGEVVGQAVCSYPERVRHLFPHDAFLQDLRAEGYVGVTLCSHDGHPIGLIAVISRSPLADRALAEATLRMVAVRAGGELERLQAEAEKERLQAQLLQARKIEAVGRLAGGVAHDFNNLLMGILGNTDLCRDELPADHPARAWLDEITADVQRSSAIVRQLLAFARKQVVAPKVLHLNDSVSAMLNLIRRLIGEDIALAWDPGRDLWPVEIDPSQIDQILANLCVNARDAIDGVGCVTLRTSNLTLGPAEASSTPDAHPGDYVVLEIRDTGRGMSPEIRDNIFEPFFTTKGLGKGTGLGLATVYGIVRQAGGFIQVESAPGRGACFRVLLPRFAGPCPVVRRETNPPPPVARGETILLVEDEGSLRNTCSVILQKLGYQVLVAESPTRALALARDHAAPIDLLLSDVIMPEMNGRELAATLTASRPGLKCLLMSGYTADVLAGRGVWDHGAGFLGKPFSREALARKLREILDAA